MTPLASPWWAALRYGLMTFAAMLILAPLMVMVAASLKGGAFEILRDYPTWRAFWATEPTGDNYAQVLSGNTVPFLRVMFNTTLIVTAIVVLGVLVNSACAYGLARFGLRGRGIMLAVIISLIILPLEAIAVPLLLLVNRMGITDTYLVQIIPFVAHPFSIFLFYQFIQGIPRDLDEAALMDGASPLRIWWQVILPLSGPAVATVAILQGLEYWSSYLWPLMVTRSDAVRPVSVAVSIFYERDPKEWGEIMAFSVLASLPIVVAFLFFQRLFIRSAMSSAVKG
jgi:multiple sugar transport system permease protein